MIRSLFLDTFPNNFLVGEKPWQLRSLIIMKVERAIPPEISHRYQEWWFLKGISFQIWRHFGYPAVGFRGCIPSKKDPMSFFDSLSFHNQIDQLVYQNTPVECWNSGRPKIQEYKIWAWWFCNLPARSSYHTMLISVWFYFRRFVASDIPRSSWYGKYPSIYLPPKSKGYMSQGDSTWLFTLPPIIMEVKNGCISNRIVTFQIVCHFPLNHDYGRKSTFLPKMIGEPLTKKYLSIQLTTTISMISMIYRIMGGRVNPKYSELVGGFNPFEKYERQNGNLPQIGVKIKNIWNHHLVNHQFTQFSQWFTCIFECGVQLNWASHFLYDTWKPSTLLQNVDVAKLTKSWRIGNVPKTKKKKVQCVLFLQGGPLPVISGVTTPISRVITPVTQL